MIRSKWLSKDYYKKPYEDPIFDSEYRKALDRLRVDGNITKESLYMVIDWAQQIRITGSITI